MTLRRVIRFAPVLAAGCAGLGSPGPSLQMRTIGASSELALVDWGVVGSRVHLRTTPRGYSGLVDNEHADLYAEGGRIVGSVGSRPIDLHFHLRDDRIQVNGLFGGRLGRLAATRDAVMAAIGPCSYYLHAVDGRYRGWRACGTRYPAELELPLAFAQLPEHRRAMLLLLLLSV
jgi:hypothetical protein